MSNVKQKPIIDELLEEYFPKARYKASIRKKAKSMALEFLKAVKVEYAMQDQIDTALFFGKELSQKEKDSIIKKWRL